MTTSLTELVTMSLSAYVEIGLFVALVLGALGVYEAYASARRVAMMVLAVIVAWPWLLYVFAKAVVAGIRRGYGRRS